MVQLLGNILLKVTRHLAYFLKNLLKKYLCTFLLLITYTYKST